MFASNICPPFLSDQEEDALRNTGSLNHVIHNARDVASMVEEAV